MAENSDSATKRQKVTENEEGGEVVEAEVVCEIVEETRENQASTKLSSSEVAREWRTHKNLPTI